MAAVDELITEHIDIWTSAVKRKSSAGRGGGKKVELYGVKKLRELILDLAVRGLLVPQDPEDEPAGVFLERIAAEKAELVKTKKIKRQKPFPKITKTEAPHELPTAWAWAYLGSLSSDIHYGYTASAQHDTTDVRLLRITDIQNDKVTWETVPGCDISDEKVEQYLLENDDILIARTGGTIGKSYLVEDITVDAVFASYLIRVKRISSMYAPYIKKYLGSGIYWKQLEENSAGTGQPNVNATALKSLFVPIPPTAEQQRIVAKVDELMALCDQLEQQTEASLTAHQTLVQTLLDSLTQAAASLPNNPQSATDARTPFEQAWNRLAEHFDIVFTTEDSIEQLKQTILQLAVMGKLVPQDPNDEPARVLLERIAAEKAELVKAKKIKKQKALPEIGEDEKPFALPDGWSWVRIGDICNVTSGFAYKSKKFISKGNCQVVRMGNIRPDFLRLQENAVFIDSSYASETLDHEIREGDILLTMTGTKGKRDYLYSLLVVKDHLKQKRLFLNQRLCILRPINLCHSYASLILKDERLLSTVYSKSTGSANQANIGMDAILKWVVPVPPLTQQQLLVDKYNEIYAHCDNLNNRLIESKATRLRLVESFSQVGSF